MNNYEWLIGRLDAFIRKYYLNQVLRGSLIFLSCLLFYIFSVSIGEYFLYLPVWTRLVIDGFFIVSGLAAIVGWVVLPLARMGRLGKVITHEQAAAIIGRHFPEVSDRLLNILQLKKQNDGYSSRELAEASINQKISQISVVPISRAVDLTKNKKYLPFLLPLVLAGVFILVAAPNVFKEGSSRLLQPTTPFEKPAPFRFIVKNSALLAVRNADFTLTVATQGNALPDEIYMDVNGDKIPMQPLDGHTFQYTFRNLMESVDFKLYAAGFYSVDYALKVVQKPALKSFRVSIGYPAYIGKKDEVRNSLSDMTLPAGTTVKWQLVAEHTDEAVIKMGNGSEAPMTHDGTGYNYSYRFLNDTAYTISLRNHESTFADSFRYMVQVIPDQFPVVQVQQFRDSVSGRHVLITGSAGDDYGITRVMFHYDVASSDGQPITAKNIPVKVTPGALVPFEQYLDIESLSLQPGQKLSYYIEAWDNDGVHGPKSSRSEVMNYFMYNENQIDSAVNENARQINSGISSSADRTQQLQKDYNDMQSDMLQSSSMSWQQQQNLQEMMNRQQQLKTQLENIKQRFEEQMQQTQQEKLSDNLQDKQQQMDKQLDNLLNQELKDEMKKLQDLMSQLNKDKTVDAMQQMEQENKLFKMDMQRMQELMKKLEMQMHLEQMANKLDNLAKQERQLQQQTDKTAANDAHQQQKNGDNKAGDNKDGNKDAQQNKNDDKTAANDNNGARTDSAGNMNADQKKGNDTDSKQKDKDGLAAESKDSKNGDSKDGQKGKDNKGSADNKNDKKSDQELAKQQDEIKKELEKAMKEDLAEAQKMAKETKQSDQMDNEAQEGKDAAGDMQESEQSLGSGQKSKASKQQGKAAQKMEDMASSLRKKSSDMDAQQVQIDIKATRQILTNLLRLSFDQEDLMDSVRNTPTTSESYVSNQEMQNTLHANSLMIRDSLFALSKHMDKLPTFVNKETTDLEQSMKRAVDALETRNKYGAISEQQFVMTHTNNLALMLNEVLSNLMQMQNEGKEQQEGMGSCSKPGSKPGTGKKAGKGAGQQLSDIISQQQQFGGELEKMMNGNKPGSKEGDGQKSQGGQKAGQNGGGKGQNGQQQNAQGDNTSGEYGNAEQLARLAEQQAKIRQQIQELSSLLNSSGSGNAKELREIQEKMDKNETDLVNRRLTNELLMRQKEIQTRMLEAEKSMREQEQDNKRQSNVGKDVNKPTPPELEKYISEQRQLLELYKTVPPELKPYYKQMVENYFKIIGNK